MMPTNQCLKKDGGSLPGGSFPVLLPLTIALFQVHADALDIAAIIADSEFFSLRLERDDLDSGTSALLANHMFQPYPSSFFSERRSLRYLAFFRGLFFGRLIVLYQHVHDLLGLHVAQVGALQVPGRILDTLRLAL